jgi:hypothetical protein
MTGNNQILNMQCGHPVRVHNITPRSVLWHMNIWKYSSRVSVPYRLDMYSYLFSHTSFSDRVLWTCIAYIFGRSSPNVRWATEHYPASVRGTKHVLHTDTLPRTRVYTVRIRLCALSFDCATSTLWCTKEATIYTPQTTRDLAVSLYL